MKALIADDDPINRLLLQRCLWQWGYEAVVVADGAKAWDALSAPEAPRLAILDWEMPGIDGEELCRRVRGLARESYTYLLLLTSRDGRDFKLQGLEAGADDYLTKPFDPAELRARLNIGRRILHLQTELIAAREAMRQQATCDGLTGTLNRATILEMLNHEIAMGRRDGKPVGVVLADLDHFKKINDTYGHQAGDTVLRSFASRLAVAVRPDDRVGRYGGEEFLLVLPDCDDQAILGVCERVRRRTAEEPFVHGGVAIPVTVSLGAAVFAGRGDVVDVVKAADTALYRSKSEGRNRASLQ
jgi:diguanylate cyclase (GGDEF)-like protein